VCVCPYVECVCVFVLAFMSPVDMSYTRALVNHLVLGVFLGASSAVLGGHGVCVFTCFFNE